MVQRVAFLRKRIDDMLFILRIYEIYSKKMPSDILVAEMCSSYRSKCSALLEEYLSLCNGEGLTEVHYD